MVQMSKFDTDLFSEALLNTLNLIEILQGDSLR